MANQIIKIGLTLTLAFIAFNCSNSGPDLSPEPTRKVIKNIPD